MNTTIFLLLCLTFLGPRTLASTNSSTSIGKDFLFALYPAEASYGVDNALFITSWMSGQCHVTFHEDTEAFMHIEVEAESTTKTILPADAQVSLLKSDEAKAVRMLCNVPVSVYVGLESNAQESAHIALILPITSLSDTYILPGLPRNGFIGVVSADDGNEIMIKLNSRCHVNGVLHFAGDTISTVLHAMYVFYLSFPSCDFGGTLINSMHPVAVFSGSLNVIQGSTRPSLVYAQALPVHMFDTNYVIPQPLTSMDNRMMRILAWTDSTFVSKTIYGQQSHYLPKLDAGQFVDEILLGNETYIYSSHQHFSVNMLLYNSASAIYKSVPGLNLYQKKSLIPIFSSFPSIIQITNKDSDLGRAYVYPNNSTIFWLDFTLHQVNYSNGVLTTSKDGQAIYVPTALSTDTFRAQVSGHRRGKYLVDTGYGDYVFSINPDLDSQKVRMTCDNDTWTISLNMSSSSATNDSFIQLRLGGLSSCRGRLAQGRLVFQSSTHDCNTMSQTINGGILYKNFLAFHNRTLNTLYCYSRNYTPTPTPTSPPQTVVHEVERYSAAIPEPAAFIHLYEDPRYHLPLGCCPIKVNVTTVYVEVASPKNVDLVMVLKDCYLTTHRNAATFSRLLIQDRCVTDRYVQLLSTTATSTRFSFHVTGLAYFQSESELNCDYQFCKSGDLSEQCRQSCATP